MPVESNKLYQVHWLVESSVADLNDAVQFRVLANQVDTRDAWSRLVTSNLQHAASTGNPDKRYNIVISPVATGVLRTVWFSHLIL